MNKKIKSIEVDSFRGYDSKQVFDLTSSHGLPANLNVLYAPNGFGKTSFLDAVEWALTGNITRFQPGSVILNTANKQAGRILHNYDSLKQAGSVKILFDDDSYIARTTKQTKKNHRRWDLNPGHLDDPDNKLAINTKPGYRIVDTLTQESTDQSVCFTTSEDRFSALRPFWDSNNDTDVYKSILGMHKAAREQKKEIEIVIEKISKNISENFRSQGIDSILNNQINTLNEINPYKLDTFSGDINIDLLNKRLELYISLKNRNINDIELTSKALNTIKYLEENYATYLLNTSNLSELSKNLSYLKEKLNYINEINNSFDNFEKLKERRTQEIIKLNKIANLRLILPEFLSINSNITSCKENIENINNEIKSKTENQSTIISKLQELEKNALDIHSKISQLSNDIVKLKENGLILEKSKIERTEFNKKSIEGQKSLKALKADINANSNTVTYLISLANINREFVSRNSDINESRLSNDFFSLKQKLETLTRNEVLLQEAEEAYEKFKDLNTSLSDVILLGKQLILDTESSTCPLCNTTQDSYTQLLERINSSQIDIKRFDNSAKIEQYKVDIKACQIDFNNELLLFNINLNKLLVFHNNRSLELRNKLSTVENNLFSINLNINNINSEILKINEWFDDKFYNIDEIELDLVIINNYYSEQTESYKSLIEKIESINKNILSLKTEIALLENTKKQYEIDINSKSSSDIYKKFLSLLKDINLSIDTIDSINVISRNAYNLIDELSTRIDIEESTVGEYLDKTQGKNKDDITSEIESLENIIEATIHSVSLFKNFYNDLIQDSDSPVLHSAILKKSKQYLDHNETLTSIHNKLTDLISFVESLKQTIDLTTQLNDNRAYLAKIEAALSELEEAKNKAIKYIEGKISTEFNEELINEIYQKVEPHPTLKKIQFVPELSGDKAKLDILARSDSQSGNTISPVVYFSSAQINILSLSIFLAKSLRNKNKVVNTIFMDDPIQFLDSINMLSFIDLIRMIISTKHLDQQIFISTHDENFFKLLKRKIDPEYYSSNFMELETFGIIQRSE